MLETVFVYTSFYQPRALMASGHEETALATLQLAGAVKPGNPRVCYNRAKVHARLGRTAEAVADLSCVAEAGWAVPDLVEGDADLQPLRDEPALQKLLGAGG